MAVMISIALFFAALVAAGHQPARPSSPAARWSASGYRATPVRDDKMGQLLRQLGNTRIGQRTISLDNETQTLLNRIGWRKASQRSMFAACQVGAPTGCWA